MKTFSRTCLFIFISVIMGSYLMVSAETNVEFIFDASNSMNESAGEEPKIDVAKKVLLNLLENWASESTENLNIGLRVYGNNFDPTKGKDAACRDTKMEVPIKGIDIDAIKNRINLIEAKGYTPIAYSLEQTLLDFKEKEGQDNIVILVSDGKESCGGDPCAVAKRLNESGIAVKINVVGFDVGPAERKQLECIAKAAEGKYYNAKNVSELQLATEQIKEEVVTHVQKLVKPEESGNLIEKKSGGRIVTATNPSLSMLIDGNTKEYTSAIRSGDEAVFAFKDNRLAEIKSVAFPIFKASDYNAKEIEILVSTESPTTGFKSLGNIELTNMVFMDNPFQEFEFEPVKARYIKFKHKSAQNADYSFYYEARVFGKLLGEETAEKPIEEGEKTNVIAAANGGKLVAATKPSLKLLNDGDEKNYTEAIRPGDEAIFGFKDNGIVEINAVAFPIFKKSHYNAKEVEILVSTDTNPTEGFVPVGTATFQNFAFMDDPYQVFSFAPVKARYIKFKHKSAQNADYSFYYEAKVFGEPSGEETVTKPVEEIKETNILAASNGGKLIAATKPSLKLLNDGDEKNYTEAIRPGDEAIFGFKDNGIVEINAVAFPIFKKSHYNAKEVEILVSTDTNPTKGYVSVGTTQLQNIAFMDNPYQTFSFDPVKARYLKFKHKSAQNADYAYYYEIKVFGKPLED